MKNTMSKKLISLMLVLAMVLSFGAVSFADNTVTTSGGSGTVPVTLTTTAATFSVTVPTSLPVSVASNGNVTVSSTAKVENNSAGPVQITDVAVTGQNGWSAVSYSTNMKSVQVDSKKFGFRICGCTTTDSGMDKSGATSGFLNTPIAQNGSYTLSYDAKLPARSSALSETTIANVVFTIGWYI